MKTATLNPAGLKYHDNNNNAAANIKLIWNLFRYFLILSFLIFSCSYAGTQFKRFFLLYNIRYIERIAESAYKYAS